MRRQVASVYVTVMFGLFLIMGGCSGSGSGAADGDDEQETTVEGEVGDEPAEEEPEQEEQPLGLPDSLAITYTVPQEGTAVSDEEVRQFTRKVMGFLKKIKYFDYVLHSTHGVDASTGKKDWQFWYSESFRKDGDLVTYYHGENLNDGGHNLHIAMSKVTGDLIAAYLLTGDQTAGLAVEKLCKGISASMLGMVRDINDPVHHLMARNVVAFNHEYLTHDHKRKAVDYSGWFSEYTRWNCYRFAYENNPWWGKVWVTNIRSKDDAPHIFRLVPVLRYGVAGAKDDNVKEACGETLELLEAFAKDIVDSDYRIRSKDQDGEIFIPGYTDDPDLNKNQGDLASFIDYRDLIPAGECNARRGAELIGYHHAINEDCGRGEPNGYDTLSFKLNSYNKRICRYFHLAHLANALVNRDDQAASQLIDGLHERMVLEKETPEEDMQYSPDDWWRDVALYLAQSHSFGYPLTNDDVRLIHAYYLKAVEKTADWPYWDPWADTVPDGTSGSYRPPDCEGDGDARVCWWRVEDLGQIFENCWSPLVNPGSARFVDCDIVRDPAQWDETAAE